MTWHKTKAMVHPAVSARGFWVMGDQVTVRAKLVGTALNVIDVTVPPGSGTPPHTHSSAEIFRILEGTLTIWTMIDGVAREYEAEPGDVVTIPGDAPHGYRNAGSVSATFMAIVDDDMIAFFEEAASKDAPSGPPTAEMVSRVIELTGRHGIQILQAA
ncbi:cupin domain-containing protein [Mesorhizobium sp. M00.F.Ca.ET.216.01.1.1]|uniref:cupin domain-containing protein n=1 Tax=Mesorhizobium sp. M00.F.Ca.ET.216.01.1.1 TaxID=2500528 RepID=UPI001FDEF227|nr:cupin domain-containing protein [Mesorhizobium sp. M00.F.Ca.ET.216.01.1.1]